MPDFCFYLQLTILLWFIFAISIFLVFSYLFNNSFFFFAWRIYYTIVYVYFVYYLCTLYFYSFLKKVLGYCNRFKQTYCTWHCARMLLKTFINLSLQFFYVVYIFSWLLFVTKLKKLYSTSTISSHKYENYERNMYLKQWVLRRNVISAFLKCGTYVDRNFFTPKFLIFMLVVSFLNVWNLCGT